MTTEDRFPLRLVNRPYLIDHRYAGAAVYPAVESLRALAQIVSEKYPEVDPRFSRDARFLRFMVVAPDQPEFDAVALLDSADDIIKATLATVATAGKSGITRTREHVTVGFVKFDPSPAPPIDIAAAAEGIARRVNSAPIYQEMVTFGPAFHNITGDAFCTPAGASAIISAPEIDSGKSPLGSPFVLDAAFHLACVWGQRNIGAVTFPIGYRERAVHVPTEPGEKYFCRLFPAGSDGDELMFDLWLYDFAGLLREVICGVRMTDVSRGKMKSPEWIADPPEVDLSNLGRSCKNLTIFEIDSIAPFIYEALSGGEAARFEGLGEKRKRSYLAARLALKRLYRKITGDDKAAADKIETVAEDGVLPDCRKAGEAQPKSISASHNERFVFAAADDSPLGIDVETVGEKPLRGDRLYLNEREKEMCAACGLAPDSAATRAWSIKESSAKLFGLDLIPAWKKIEITALGEHQSTLRYGENIYTAVHLETDGNLFTILPGASARPSGR